MIDARSLHELGVESLDSERTDDALNCFEMALDLDPGFVMPACTRENSTTG